MPSSFDAKECAERRQRIVVKVASDEDRNCPLCLEPVRRRPVYYLPCGHSFHMGCHRRLRRSVCLTKHLCPECRHPAFEEPSCEEVDMEALMDVIVSFSGGSQW